ncbi:MAG: helix-turn-helix domain-containing protein [Pseudomonadota bacterium]
MTNYCPNRLKKFFTWTMRQSFACNIRQLSKPEAAVWFCLVRHADKNGAGFIKMSTIAAETGYDRNAIGRAYKKLCRRGLVRRVLLRKPGGHNSVFGYAVLIPLQFCELTVRYLCFEPCNAAKQHNSPIEQYNINADRLFRFEAGIIQIVTKRIEFSETPKMISVAPVSQVVYGADPSDWTANENKAIELAKQLVKELKSRRTTLKNWSPIVDLLSKPNSNVSEQPVHKAGLVAAKPIPSNGMIRWLSSSLTASQLRNKRLQNAFRETEVAFTPIDVTVRANSKLVIDTIDEQCSAFFRKFAKTNGQDVILLVGEDELHRFRSK